MSGVVVVGVDGSPSARKAAEVALGLAKALGGSLHIVTAFDVDRSETFGRGKPADALIKEAMRLDARLIVVGNRRMRGIGRLLGSVANSVAHNAPCDVYIANTYDD